MPRPRSRFRGRAKRRVPSSAVRRTNSVKFPAGPSLAYRKAIKGVVREVLARVSAVLTPALDQFAFHPEERADASDVEVFSRLRRAAKPNTAKVRKVATTVARRVDTHVETEFERVGIKLTEAATEIAKLTAGWIKENTDLITSLLGDEIDTISSLLEDNQNRTVDALKDRIQERFDVTESKADLLARDQALKLNSQITQARQTAAGIEEYIWTTSGDERVRETHAELDGQKFRWDDPPITNDNGDRNNPGEDYQCRCTAFPVLPETSDDDEE
jgi:SPP1 gp7 family putative phage head morphogenesis protein